MQWKCCKLRRGRLEKGVETVVDACGAVRSAVAVSRTPLFWGGGKAVADRFPRLLPLGGWRVV